MIARNTPPIRFVAPVAAVTQILDVYLWENRVLLLFAPDEGDEALVVGVLELGERLAVTGLVERQDLRRTGSRQT